MRAHTRTRTTWTGAQACVDYVLPGGAFDLAGVRVGDLIMDIEGQPISAPGEVRGKGLACGIWA